MGYTSITAEVILIDYRKEVDFKWQKLILFQVFWERERRP